MTHTMTEAQMVLVPDLIRRLLNQSNMLNSDFLTSSVMEIVSARLSLRCRDRWWWRSCAGLEMAGFTTAHAMPRKARYWVLFLSSDLVFEACRL